MSKNEQITYLVFYLDRDMMNNPQIIQPFADSVNNILAQKDANAIAFFLPTDDNERIECISKVPEGKEEDFDKLLNDIKKNFNQ
jgi:hypothetical protein